MNTVSKRFLGEKIGRLTLLSTTRKYNSGKMRAYWVCKCDCGTELEVRSDCLNGNTLSCGCYGDEVRVNSNTKHGALSKNGSDINREYIIYQNIKKRCFNKNSKDYIDYGNRGIKICDRWLGDDGFANFMADMGRRPSKIHSIDRINNNGNYEPSNCRWATPKEQANNRRSNRFIMYKGQIKTLGQWAEVTGIKAATLWIRLKNKTVEQAFR